MDNNRRMTINECEPKLSSSNCLKGCKSAYFALKDQIWGIYYLLFILRKPIFCLISEFLKKCNILRADFINIISQQEFNC